MDGNILLFIQEFIRNPILTPVFLTITHLGDKGLIWILICLILLSCKRTRKVGVMGLLALLGSLLLNNMLLKNLVARPRPFYAVEGLTILINTPSEFSFPSGHTASSFAAASVFFRNLPRCCGVPAIGLAALIGFSRLYIGIHYPTDVLFGMLTGIIIGYMAEKCILFSQNRI